ncbi:MAG TPA: sulfite exporter TauE/SafE family protein [Kofleriaceae bacterium]|nr:sulfite exporter TauE/SafE family protein [Kofleriaceae bacterium]
MDVAHVALVGGAAFAAGLVNAIAGGGSLITFPALVACGVPEVVASLTNTVALCPGYLGATVAQRRELAGQGARAAWILPAGALGGAAGALLLLATGEAAFDVVVPFLLVFAAALLGVQDRLRRRIGAARGHAALPWAALAVALAAVYGGYFGAGLGVIVLAALAVALDDTLTRLNALKQVVSLVVNVAAALVFVISGRVDWPVAAVMAAAALIGGALGGALASRVPASLLRVAVVALALAVAIYYFARL